MKWKMKTTIIIILIKMETDDIKKLKKKNILAEMKKKRKMNKGNVVNTVNYILSDN
jgi:hypothetical protein